MNGGLRPHLIGICHSERSEESPSSYDRLHRTVGNGLDRCAWQMPCFSINVRKSQDSSLQLFATDISNKGILRSRCSL